MKRWLSIFFVLYFATCVNAQTTTTSKIGEEDLYRADGINDTFSRRTSTGGSLTVHKVGQDEIDVAAAYGSNAVGEAALRLACSKIPSTSNRKLLLRPGTWSIAANLTIPAHLELYPAPGAIIVPASGVTVTIGNLSPAVGAYRWIDTSSSGAVVFSAGAVRAVRPEWWTTNTTPGTTDMSSAIASAQTAADGVAGLELAPYQSYGLASSITFDSSPRVLFIEGNGAQLIATAAMDQVVQIENPHASGSEYASYYHRWRMEDLKINAAGLATYGLYVHGMQHGILRNIQVEEAISHGIYIYAESGYGTYYSRFDTVVAINNGGDGINATTNDAPSNRINANEFIGCISKFNIGDGFSADYAQNDYIGCTAEINDGYGWNFDHCLSNVVSGGYSENNHEGIMTAGYSPGDNIATLEDGSDDTTFSLTANSYGVKVFGGRHIGTQAGTLTGLGNYFSSTTNYDIGFDGSDMTVYGGLKLKDSGSNPPGIAFGSASLVDWGINTSNSALPIQLSGSNYLYLASSSVGAYKQLNAATDGLVTKVKAGTIDDGDFTVDTNGLLAIDSTNGRIYFRYLGGWHYAAQDAGFQIRSEDAYDHLVGPEARFRAGDLVLGIVTGGMQDGAIHAEYCTLAEALRIMGVATSPDTERMAAVSKDMRALHAMQWNHQDVEVPENDATEEYDAEVPDGEAKSVKKTMYQFNAVSGKSVKVERDEQATKTEKRKRLKPGIWLDEQTGKFYRRVYPTKKQAEALVD